MLRVDFKWLSKNQYETVITPTNHDRSKQREEPIKITRNLLQARKKSRVQGSIGFCFAPYWLKNLARKF